MPAGTHVQGLQGQKSSFYFVLKEWSAAGVTSSKSTVEHNNQEIISAAFNTKMKLLYVANYWKILRGGGGFLK